MRFSELKGNEAAKAAVAGMVDSGRIPHAIMFHEDDGGGGVSFCLALLQYVGCASRSGADSCGVCPWCNKIAKLIHPDVHFVFPVTGGSIIPSSAKPTSLSYVKQWRELVLGNPFFTERDLDEALGIEGKSALISVGDAKEILGCLSFNSLEGGYRAVVVYLPEKMNADAANRLLKSLEEPPQKTLFLLVTHAPEKVLPTIASRCQCIRLAPVSRSELSVDSEQMRELFAGIMGAVVARDLQSALEAGEAVAALPSRDKVKAFIKYASSMMREIFLVQQGLRDLSGSSSEDVALAATYAPSLKKSFSRSMLPVLDRAYMLVERNVNQKIVICDLVNKLFAV